MLTTVPSKFNQSNGYENFIDRHEVRVDDVQRR